MRSLWSSILLAILATLCALPSGAQDFDVISQPSFSLGANDDPQEEPLQIYTAFSILPAASIENSDGSVSATRLHLGAKYSIFSLNYGYTAFDWSSSAALGAKTDQHAPWNSLHDLSLQARILKGTFQDRWHYWLNAEVSSAFEEGFPGAVGAGLNGELAFDFWEGWMIGGTVGVTALNPLNKDLFADGKLGLALHVSQRHVRNALAALGLINPKETNRDKYSLRFGYSVIDKTYRLAPGSKFMANGYAGIRRSKIGAYLDLHLSEHFTLSLGPEYHFKREFTAYDSSGNRKSSNAVRDTGGGYIGLNWAY